MERVKENRLIDNLQSEENLALTSYGSVLRRALLVVRLIEPSRFGVQESEEKSDRQAVRN